MKVVVRPYRSDEFDRACEIRGIDTPAGRERFAARLTSPGEWVDHYLHLGIEADGELVGDFQLRQCDRTRPNGAWEMGLELIESSRGKGIGTQALKAGAEFAFNHGAHRIEGSTEENNQAMRKAFEKAGWKFEGVLRALFVADGIAHDYYSYAITKFD